MKIIYERFTKRTLFAIFILHFSLLSFASTYYVSNAGNDLNSGLTEALAWKTLTKVSAFAFNAGDQILFRKGDAFYGTIIVKSSGTSGNPITFGAYGAGANPIITGFTTVTSWTNLGSNIWESTYAISGLLTCEMVVINGVNIPVGRYPNSGYLPYQSFSTNTSITSSSINSSTTNWTGAEVVIRKNHWILESYLITNHSGGTITYANGGYYNGQNDWGFFIQNDKRTLDLDNEWYYNPSTKKISVYSTTSPTNVKVSTIDKLIYINGFKYITFNGLSFQGSNTDAISITAPSGEQYIEIMNCNISYSGKNAIVAENSKYIKIENSIINHTNDRAVSLDYGCSNALIRNNIIKNTGIQQGMGTGDYKSIHSEGSISLIEFNTIDSTGYCGIYFKGNSVLVKNNFVNNSCLLLDDGAGIYTYLGDGETAQTGRQIIGNIVLNSKGNSDGTSSNETQAQGIYLDGNTVNVDVIGNTVANGSNYGIFVNGSKNIKIEDNTLFNNQTQLYFYNWGPGITGIGAKNNIYFSKHYSQLAWSFYTAANDIANFGFSDANYYARPFDDKLLIQTFNLPVDGYLGKPYNLAAWKAEYSQDQNSVNQKKIHSEYDYTLIGSNKYSNEKFNSNVNDVAAGNCTKSWNNNGVLDGGCLQLNNANSNKNAYIQLGIGAVSSTKTYILKFSSRSIKNDSYLKINMIQNNSPWTQTEPTFTSIDTARIETQLLITPTINDASANLMFTLDNADKTVWIDNFQFYEVDTTRINVDEYIRFEYNPSSLPKTYTVIDPMLDVKGMKYAASITLQPYTSVVLMKDLTPVVAPSAPTSPVATAGNASASVVFVAPVSNGGSAITGYTVTSIPAGGIDVNAGSTSLTHILTGLTNGNSYTFIAKATNSAGTSVASLVSNSVVPKAPMATAFAFTGPSSDQVNTTSANFTVTPNNLYTGTITITPSGAGSAGLSTKVLTFSNSSTAQTFTITPTVSGSITLTATNNGTLINPVPITYTTNAILPDAPTSVVATSADGSVSVTFMAPTNTGGSAITGYTVTSSPAGGIDSNAGSTLLTHTITGLTNGTYTFTVKATSSVGSSVASVASNPIENIITKQGEIVTSHFTTVWQGLNGLNHMNINVVSAVLEDVPLSVDDEIAVFSGSACVGTSKLTKAIVPTDNSTFLTILASQNDGSGNGFTDNDTIVFKIWNSKAQTELQINAVVYRNDITTWKTNGRYSPGATTVVEIASYQVYTQSIELLKGYNMISTYVSAQNPNVSAVTKTILDQGNLIKMQDETGNSFENWGTFGGWINQIGSLEETEGYKIQVANNCTLQVTGRVIAMPFNISLKAGWNIISYPRTDVVNAINVVQALIDQNKLVKVQDESGNSIENWGLFGGWKNGIGNFIPGKAYKLKMSADAILTFHESYPKSAVVIAKSEQTEHYSTSVEGNGTDHMNINITGLNNIGISEGDELAAFDGAVCVATTKITEENLLSGSASLASSLSTDNQNQNGFKVGDAIKILVWNKLSGDESKVNTEVITGQMKYEKNASVLVKMKSASIATSVVNLNDAVKIDVFPNPCQGKVTVRFSEITEANSRIEISDLSGRKLVSRIISDTSEVFNLDSFTPGLYIVKSILGKNEYVQKLIVNK